MIIDEYFDGIELLIESLRLLFFFWFEENYLKNDGKKMNKIISRDTFS